MDPVNQPETAVFFRHQMAAPAANQTRSRLSPLISVVPSSLNLPLQKVLSTSRSPSHLAGQGALRCRATVAAYCLFSPSVLVPLELLVLLVVPACGS